MTLSKGDKVVILDNDYDDVRDPDMFHFKDELGTVEMVNHAQDGSITAYQIRLDDQRKHEFLSGGDPFLTWPFYENELQSVA